jgi:uncharacterized repeat protein (TIGR01451 family)
VELVDPVGGVGLEEGPDRAGIRAVVVDRLAPLGLVLGGEVRRGELTQNGAHTVLPGGSFAYPHEYIAGSSVQVSFTTVDAPDVGNPNWSSALFTDADCDNDPAGETVVVNPVKVDAGKTVCVLNKVTSPFDAPNGARNVTTVQASEALLPNPESIPDVILESTDITTVGPAGLSLNKQVRTLTACPEDAAESLANPEPFTFNNTALPGRAIEYRITNRNDTLGPMKSITITDVVPPPTQFDSIFCLQTPTLGINVCTPTHDAGDIAWTLVDSATDPSGLQAGGEGSVSFCVMIPN